jgi:hypothetical protein
MIKKKIYEEKSKTQKVWYDSSMMVYSEMVESDVDNVGELYVVFKNGWRYVYHNVKFEDYVLLLAGGTDASQGKTLNKVIKNKYEYERLDDADLVAIENDFNKEDEKLEDISNTYFISGHRDITETEFEINYASKLDAIITNNPEARFVVGDYQGVDIMAQNYLLDVLNIDPSRITVYHMFDKPRNVNPKVTNLIGGFLNDEERDSEMTRASVEDIAVVRDYNKLSGTAINILRRNQMIIF